MKTVLHPFLIGLIAIVGCSPSPFSPDEFSGGEKFSRDLIAYIIGPEDETLSTDCLRKLGNLDQASAKEKMSACVVAGSSRSALGMREAHRGNSWWFNPYSYYSPYWCHYYLAWPNSWACDYFWPRRNPTPPQQTCNQACLCQVTYFNQYCPAVACSLEDLRACGVYPGRPAPLPTPQNCSSLKSQIFSLAASASGCTSDAQCSSLPVNNTCEGVTYNSANAPGLANQVRQYNARCELSYPPSGLICPMWAARPPYCNQGQCSIH